ncbi:MAG: dTDP-glucose 4,6-dehydratase [Polyangiaceae bacterium]|nr:dTDP-glucose 4,6-dehydratase [Polyangiaceae bacterium]
MESTVRLAKNILVTGGLGFIGSAFIRFLFREGLATGRVLNVDALTYAANPANLEGAVDPDRYRFVHGDIGEPGLVPGLIVEHAIDTIVHFAAETHVDRSILGPEAFIQTNVVGTFRLLEAVRAQPQVHFHHVSTDEVYGSLGPTGLFTEETPYDPRSPYSATKAASDHLVRAYAHTYGVSTTLSNCSNNYGPFQFPEKLVPLMILNMLERKPLPVYGDGTNVRDWLYVDDHAEAIWAILVGAARGSTYNVSGATERTNLALLRELMHIVAELTGAESADLERLITFVKDRPGHDQRYALDATRLRQDLAWSPRHDLASGLRNTVRWYLDHPGWVAATRSGTYREWIERNYETR